MTPLQALQKLRNDPHYFLKHYPLSTAGATDAHAANAANLFNFYIQKRAGTDDRGKVSHVGASRPVRGLPMFSVDISSFRISRQLVEIGVPSQQFPALNVPMVFYDTIHAGPGIGAMAAYLLDNTADVMITGQLSNCCFCIVPYAGGLACAHVNPRGYPGGAAAAANLQTDLTANGHFVNYPGGLITFGRQNYPMQATVIGVRSAGGWEIFAQQTSDSGKTITGAFQVYPPPLTPL